MKTYTESQKAQLINFYQQWLPHVQNFGYENLPHGTHEFYRHGKKFFKEQQATQDAEKRNAARNTPRWTRPQYLSVARGYLKYGKNGYAKVIEDFTQEFGPGVRSNGAIKAATYSCAHLDTQSDVKGLKDHAGALLDILRELVPGERFSA